MSETALPFLEFGAPRGEAEMTIILMHGLGADGHDFADVAAALCKAAEPRAWRFVLPHAPVQKVTINMGMPMPAWYDIIDFSHPREVNWDTVQESQDRIEELLENEKGAEKIILAGFSQGGAMALHVGLRALCYIPGINVELKQQAARQSDAHAAGDGHRQDYAPNESEPTTAPMGP